MVHEHSISKIENTLDVRVFYSAYAWRAIVDVIATVLATSNATILYK